MCPVHARAELDGRKVQETFFCIPIPALKLHPPSPIALGSGSASPPATLPTSLLDPVAGSPFSVAPEHISLQRCHQVEALTGDYKYHYLHNINLNLSNINLFL